MKRKRGQSREGLIVAPHNEPEPYTCVALTTLPSGCTRACTQPKSVYMSIPTNGQKKSQRLPLAQQRNDLYRL